MGSRCYECAEIDGYCTCPDRAIYNEKQLHEAIRAEHARLAGLVQDKISHARKVQDERDALNKDTIVQDCKIDAWESVLALLTEIGEQK